MILLDMSFTWSNLIYFLIGFLNGMIVLALIYIILLARSVKPQKVSVENINEKFPQEELQALVDEKVKLFKDKKMRKEVGTLEYLKELSISLCVEIATKVSPDSKHPCLELTIDEILLLCAIVLKRLDALFGRPILRGFRKTKAAKVMTIYDVKRGYDNSLAAQAGVEAVKEANKVRKVLRIINPVTWASFIVTGLQSFTLKYVCIIAITYVGEEAYKLYSRKMFHEDVDVDLGSEKIFAELEAGIKEDAKYIDYEPKKKKKKEKKKELTAVK